MVAVQQARLEDLAELAPLFDAYRQFYGMAADLELARHFIGQRLQQRDSVILLARGETGAALGFTQLYPSFSSVSASPIFILNDLYVIAEARRLGVATALLNAAAEFARGAGAARLTLSTALTNTAAQRLYESLGWQRDTAFCDYNLQLGPRIV